MMDEDEAFALIVAEGLSARGIVVSIRGGSDPGRERVDRLRVSLVEMRAYLDGNAQLDRRLAFALYALSNHMHIVYSLVNCDWIDIYDEIFEVIEQIFEGNCTDATEG